MLKTDKKNRLASVFMEKEWERDSMSEWSTVRLKIVSLKDIPSYSFEFKRGKNP